MEAFPTFPPVSLHAVLKYSIHLWLWELLALGPHIDARDPEP
jgi:hypothetical protein